MKTSDFADVWKQTQYKPNTNPIPERPKMNENLFATKGYENITTFRLRQNKANTNPIQTQPVVSLSNLFLKIPERGLLGDD